VSKVQYIQVAIPVPMRQLFTYSVPHSLFQQELVIGQRVLVNFSNRQVIGIILSIDDNTLLPVNKIKPILSQIKSDNHYPKQLLKLLTLCADYYQHPIGEVLQQGLPALLRQIDPPKIAPVMHWFTVENTHNATINSSLEKIQKKAPKQFSLYQLIATHPKLSWVEIRTLGFTKSQLNSLESKGLIEQKTAEITSYHWQNSHLNTTNKHQLSTEQAIVVSAITNRLNQFVCHLIDGITGSGKTEVYLQSMEKVLSAHQQVLVLVPEIGLTPQTLSRFEQRFNVPIFLHHSGLNDRERYQTWFNALNNNAAIVIGTRSAVFTPLTRLGLIIVDEEHDGSFKQQDSFRYNGRDVALIRAKQLNIPIVLGSATPSFESLHNAHQKNYGYHQLTKRAGNSKLAKMSLINTSEHVLESGLSSPLKEAIKQTLNRGEQVLVFLNRRGYAPAIKCNQCQWVAHCLHCDKPYTLHRQQGLLICHHCATFQAIPKHCPSCQSVDISPLGQGTEQIEQHLSELFTEHSIVRIDRDSTRKKGELSKLLQQVSNNQHHILIGTQMLAKGHHFPNVTLVAMLDIDGALFSYDFRATEHMAQLLVQVAGRAGRESKLGRVLIQTNFPEHPLLQDLVHNGYPHFAMQGLKEREKIPLPPFSFHALIRAEANYPSYPEKFLQQIALCPLEHCQFIGPMPAAMEKKAGKYRYHLIIQSNSRAHLHQNIRLIIAHIEQQKGQHKLRWSIDIDPIDLSW
jgi:primosomal protein N' (replication factor Y)